MIINPRTILLSILGLSAPYLVAAQVTVNQLVGYGSLNGGIPISGSVVTVTTCSALASAVGSSSPMTVRINGALVGCGVMNVASNKFILGVGSTAVLREAGFLIFGQSRVIIRNITFRPPPLGEDSITIEDSTNVWVDHCVFESDMDHDKDYYDGLIDITHGSDWITISWCKFLNHWKGSLVGHSDLNEDEDTGRLHVTYHHNYWNTINSRTPSYRFGTGHIYSSCFLNIGESGINSRMGAVLKIEQCYFENAVNAIATNLYSAEEGYVQLSSNVFSPDTCTTSVTQTMCLSMPYQYWTTAAGQVCAVTMASAGVGIVTTLP